MKRVGQSVLNISLWIVGFGLMLASSGLDGAFLVKLMPVSFGWLGLVLNTTTDIGSEVIAYWCGRLAQDASKRKRAMSQWLWLPQFALVMFAWLFGWRQIIPILRTIEPQDWRWLAPIMAAFTPVSLVAVGYTQALLAGKIEEDKPTQQEHKVVAQEDKVAPKVVQAAQPQAATIRDWYQICASLNGDRATMTASRVNELLTERGFAQKADSTARYWARYARGVLE